jgi:hypothetical protein
VRLRSTLAIGRRVHAAKSRKTLIAKFFEIIVLTFLVIAKYRNLSFAFSVTFERF